jgi:hypothetical protein
MPGYDEKVPFRRQIAGAPVFPNYGENLSAADEGLGTGMGR